jgi:hypothetical protein
MLSLASDVSLPALYRPRMDQQLDLQLLNERLRPSESPKAYGF